MRDGSLVPGVATLRVPANTAGSRSCTRLVHAKSCTRPLGGWTKVQQRVGSQRPRGGRARSPHWLAHARSGVHTMTSTHVRPDTRAARNSRGRRKETVGQEGEEMK
ncbi:hypothetical protein NN561_002977 [Cricetulus griseus]